MNPRLISVDARQPPPKSRFSLREFRRALSLAWPYRKILAIGLLSTVVFAALHTISIAGVFPVLKVLLEREGLQGWVDRTIAGQRLAVEFAQPTDSTGLVVVGVHGNADRYAPGIQPSDVISDIQGRPIPILLNELASVDAGTVVPVLVDSRGEQQRIELRPGELERKQRLAHWAASLVPDDAAQGKLRALMYILTGLIVVVLMANVFRYFGEVLVAKAVLSSMIDLRAQLYERTLHLPMSFFSGQPTADLVTRFVQDVQEIQRGLMTFFGKFIREPLRAVLILAWAFTLDWRITLTMIVVAPLTIAVFWAVGRSVKKANRKLLQGYGDMLGALTASLQNLRVVKAYTAEEHERKRLRDVDLKMFKQQVKLAKLQAFVSPMIETLAVVAGGVVTVWLASRVLQQELSISKFVTLGVTLSMLFDPLRKLTDVYVRVQRSTAGAERIFRVIDQPIETDLTTAQIELKPLEKGIEIVNVSFTYPGAETPALREITLSIHKGETLAIVGPNGCGKTTLVSMLPRLFVPDSGEICYDGVDISNATLKSLREQIGLVSQEAIVFAGTPVENIAYGRPQPEDDRVQDAARRAHADEFIRNIPDGYDANLGERGTTLSGGQRQRLTIARAIFRDAPILIFDEATSQIDTESELKIQEAVQDFARERTTLIIAHRLSTIQFANRIIVMDAGRIIDSGTHKDLFDRCPLYRSLCETQFLTEPPTDD
jgi:ABC-type multidrug transport system fused ATPase/permease subunit